jgi:hypothetical protein
MNRWLAAATLLLNSFAWTSFHAEAKNFHFEDKPGSPPHIMACDTPCNWAYEKCLKPLKNEDGFILPSKNAEVLKCINAKGECLKPCFEAHKGPPKAAPCRGGAVPPAC